MSDYNIVKYILDNTDKKQKDIAKIFDVSDVVVSRWKKGSKIPRKTEVELMKLAGVWWDNLLLDSKWAIIARSEENSNKWYDFIEKLSIDSFYQMKYEEFMDHQLVGEMKMQRILIVLFNAGIEIPAEAPEVVDLNYVDSYEHRFQGIMKNYLYCYSQASNWWHENFSFYPASDNRDYFYSLVPRIALQQLSIEDPTIMFPGANAITLQKYTDETRKEYIETVFRFCNELHMNGLEYDQPSLESFIDFNPDYPLPKEGLDETEESEKNIEKYMSLAEREIMRGIKKNEETLAKILKILKG